MALVTGGATASQAQTFTFYTNETAWQNALFSFVHENFDNGTLTAPGLSFTSAAGAVTASGGNGFFSDRVVNATARTRWNLGTYPGGVNAFGGNWDLTPAGPGQGIEFAIHVVGFGIAPVTMQIPNSYSGQFFGWITNPGARFDWVEYTGGTQPGSAETYTLDDLQYGVTATPEPATYSLLATGGALLFGAIRWRRRAT